MTRLLITGGCGFIGSNLTEYLLEKTNWHINILDNLSTGNLNNIKNLKNFEKKVNFIKGDIVNHDDVLKAIKNCDYVVNLAAQTSVMESIKNPYNDLEINIIGLLNLLDVAVNIKIKKFIHSSSAAAVGEQNMPVAELKVPMPISPYGASKLAGESYCCAFSKSYGLKSIVLRFSNVYGSKSYNKGSVIAKFIKQIIRKETLEIYGNGTQTRDFVHVKDICSGIYLSIIKETKVFDLFQLGTGIETTINLIIDYLKEISKEKKIKFFKIKYCEKRPGDITRNYADISKAKKKLGFSLNYDLETGLQETFDWFLKNY